MGVVSTKTASKEDMMRLFLAIFCMTTLFGFDSTIPIVDMKDFHDLEKREQFLETLGYAVKEIGFFGVVNTGIDGDVVDRGYADSVDFFHLDYETKLKYDGRTYGGERGYTPKYREVALGHTVGNFMEYYHIGREYKERMGDAALLTPNLWPEEKDIRSTGVLFDEIERCGEPIVEAFALLMGKDAGYLKEKMIDGETILRMIHYPATKETPKEGSFWAAPHVDNCLFTILPKATAKGLEVQLNDGTWVPVITPDNVFIVNIGEKFVNLTNGLFKSSMHRVRAPDDEPELERYSMVQFNHPRAAVDLTPVDTCIEMTGGVQRFPKATSRELLLEFLVINEVASDEMIREYAQSGLSERRIELGVPRIDALRQLERHQVASEEVMAYLTSLE